LKKNDLFIEIFVSSLSHAISSLLPIVAYGCMTNICLSAFWRAIEDLSAGRARTVARSFLSANNARRLS
jgi:hypothetical protein